MANKSFSDLITFSRGTGATRVNSSGLLVGVDFSSTSNTIATGSKTFALTADANVNRDWPVGANVIVVAQAGATGSMTGVVTSYTPSTQSLVINVTSVTGSGTSTDWRIGSLDMREDYDPVTLVKKGVLSESGVTNTFLYSDNISNGYWTKNANVTASIGTENNRAGSKAQKVALNAEVTNGVAFFLRPFTLVSGETHTYSTIIKSDGSVRWIQFYVQPNNGGGYIFFDVIDGLIGNSNIILNASITPTSNGFFRIIFSHTASLSTVNDFRISLSSVNGAGGFATFTGSVGNGIHIAELQRELGNSPTSYIPTTTAQVTRNADNFALTSTAINSIRQGEGTLYAEITCDDTGTVQKRALRLSGSTGDIRLAKRGTGTLSAIQKMATDGVTDVFGLNNSTNNVLRNVGNEYLEVNNTSGTTSFGVASSSVENFITVGSAESIVSTSNSFGVSEFRDIGAAAYQGAHFGIGRFVIASGTRGTGLRGAVVVSTDGLSFRRVNIPGLTQGLIEVTSNGTNQYVAVGQGGVIYTSPDAETWTAQTSGTASQISGVTRSTTHYVVVIASTNPALNIRRSTDGVSWVSVANSNAASTLNDVHAEGAVLVAVGGGGVITRSTDNGATWTASASPTTQVLNGIYFADGLWVAVGVAGTVVTSPDGITWTDRTATSGTTQNISEVNFFNGKFYYVSAAAGTVFENTASGIVSGIVATSRSTTTSGGLNGIAASATRLLICGTSGAITTSEDGVTFTSRTGNAAQLNGAAFGNGTYVVVGNVVNGSGLIATVDPVTFAYQRRLSGTTARLDNVKFLNGAFYVVTANVVNRIFRTSDGISYSEIVVTVGGGQNHVGRDIAFGAGVFVAVAGQSYAISSDGTSFVSGVTRTGADIQAIDFANSLFVAVGAAGTIITSPNGTTWTLRTSGTTQNLNSVMFSTRDNLWYAAGNGGVLLYSPDAITWTAVQNSGTASILGTTLQSNQPLPQFKNGVNKIGISYKSNQVISALNGITSSTDITASIPSITAGNIGENLNGYIRKIDIYTTALTAAEMSAKTM
jgi:hypothetical protein